MAQPKVKQIDRVKAKAGRLIKVWNTQKKKFSNALDRYTAVWVEDFDGENERCLLFTKKELARAEHRAKQNPEDLPKKGFLTDIFD
tara:strand:- start:1809 stop:2066 length:258 start_codon:yes stop_codon:yes gene_type:complete